MTSNTYHYNNQQGLVDDSGYTHLQADIKICKSCMFTNKHEGFVCKNCGMPLYKIHKKENEPILEIHNQIIKFDGETIYDTVYVKGKGKSKKYITIDDVGNSYLLEQIGGRLWLAVEEYNPKLEIEQAEIPDTEVRLTPKWSVGMTLKPKGE